MTTVQELIDTAKAEGNCLDAEQAAAKVQAGDAVLVDLREPAEHEAAAIPVAVHIPRGVLEFKIAEACPDKTAELVLHCGGGGRASLAAQSLKTLGYENVYIVDAQFDEFLAACNSN